MKPTLLILAAGIGTRYGGLKQLDQIGINGETIMDYSIFDAIRTGFGKIVFVIRESFKKDFNEKILQKYKCIIQTEVVFQSLNKLPKEFVLHTKRVKPWGTNHAVMMGEEVIHEPFVVINADDFYGQKSFKILTDYLKSINKKQNNYAMIGYKIGNTLSKNGPVTRGICKTDKDKFLSSITECSHIIRSDGGKIICKDYKNNSNIILNENTIVSMNMWIFAPEYFNYSKKLFLNFLTKNLNSLEAEFLIPSVINQLINEKKIKIKVLKTSSKWFGMTYLKDRTSVISEIENLIKKNIYPKKLFQ
ncbi:MAG: nucleotidyltransferase [Bacteroidales bacterium OttesenSCG-928-I14]|jgi:dTDP-glucose pyrophosphorylase|nr:nucleotidyltransferase [Bacteroidales bacterium OttesenSCG-928-I14]